MPTDVFYLKNSVASGSSYGSLTLAAPSSLATTGTGWIVGTTTGTSYSLMVFGSKLAEASFDTAIQPSVDPNNNDSWRSEAPINGTYAAGTWIIALSVISASNAASGSGRLRVRVWKSANADGSSPTELTTSTITTSQYNNLSTGTPQNLSGSQSFSATTFNNEYLFIQVACQIDAASADPNADIVFRVDSANSKITTPDFIGSVSSGYIDIITGFSTSTNIRYNFNTQDGNLLNLVVSDDTTPPNFNGLQSVGDATSSTLTLSWSAATDSGTPSGQMEYDIYQSSTPGGENLSSPTYTTTPGSTSYVVQGLSQDSTYYFIVRARDKFGNRDSNMVELSGTTAPGPSNIFIFG